MRWIGDYLHTRGLTVSGPLLPGHGTTPEAMNCCRWTDWTGHVEAALADLRACCTRVFVGGLSMGSLLTLHLAAQHPDLSGVIDLFPCRLDRHFEDLLDPSGQTFRCLSAQVH